MKSSECDSFRIAQRKADSSNEWTLLKRVTDITLGWGIGICTSWMQRKVVRELVVEHGIDVVHEPIPVSPRQPSLITVSARPL